MNHEHIKDELRSSRGYDLPMSAFPDNVAPLAQAWIAMLAACA